MATRRSSALIAVVFAAALVAGGAAGMLATRYLEPAQPVTPAGELPLSEALQLTPDQREQIRQIWESVRSINQNSYAETQMLQHLEDDEILKLLNDEQKKEFVRIHQVYQDKFTAADAKRKRAFDEAVEKTKQLLNPDQRRRYEEILARRLGTESPPQQPASSTTRPMADSPAASVNFSAAGGGRVSPG